jgi:DNA-nicking Smr family endonuclease
MTDDEDVFQLPIDGVLDLHAFQPADCKSLVPEYLQACRDKGIAQVRIIHGKGRGVLRKSVQSILARDPAVLEFHQAEENAGGWGATIIVLKPRL